MPDHFHHRTVSHNRFLVPLPLQLDDLCRFIGVAILNYIDPALLLSFYGFCCSLFCILVSQLPGYGAIRCLFCLFFFESICYPVRSFSYLGILIPQLHVLSVHLHSGYEKPRNAYQAGHWSYRYGVISHLLTVPRFSLNPGCCGRGFVSTCTRCPRR